MSDLKKVIKAEDIDAALLNIEKSISEKKIVIEKSVDKRAMGGDQKSEAENEVIAAAGDDRKGQTKVGAGTREVSKLQGNFAEKYPMDAAKEGGLEAAIADSVKAPTREKTPVNKAVEQSAEPSEIAKAADQSSESSSIVKAADASSSYSSMSKAVASASSSSSSMKKAADASSSSTSSKKNPFVKKAVVPAEEPASKTAKSGAPQLAKSIKLIGSANKHLTKAYEGGSDTELDIAGERLVAAKTTILKAITDGEKVSAEIVKSFNKSAKYFGKALASFENDKIEEHVKAVEKSQKYMLKAINAYDLVKSVAVEEKVVEKSTASENFYKSFLKSAPVVELKSTKDEITPVLKSLVKTIENSQKVFQTSLTEKTEKENDFKKSVTDAVTILSKSVKQNIADLAAINEKPNVRKSVLTEVASPLADEKKNSIEISHVADILLKGMQKGLCGQNVLLAWDVDKDLPEYQEKYLKLCEKIQRS